MGTSLAPIATRAVSVRGGTHGIAARMHDITNLARLYGAAGAHCGVQSLAMQRYLLDPAVIASATLDPVGAARFELAMAAALDGPHGLTMLAVECGTTEVTLRATADAYTTADGLQARYLPAVEGIGHVKGAYSAFRKGDRRGGRGGLRTGADAAVTADPFVLDSADLLLGWFLHPIEADAVKVLPDGRADVRSLGSDGSPEEQPPPRSLRDLLAGLAVRNRPSTGGDVDVRFVYATDAGGRVSRRVIVDIPGQKNWSEPQTAASATVHPDPTDWTTSLRSIENRSTTYEQGVLEAMRKAGVGRGEPVLLVGHSQGGMVAANIAAAVAKTHEFHISNVVTAGSPIGLSPIPLSVRILSIENDGDVVPHCDGADNPDRVNQTTVTVHRNSGDIQTDHDLNTTYVPGAADVDACDDLSVRSYLKSVQGFLSGDRVVTKVYHVARV